MLHIDINGKIVACHATQRDCPRDEHFESGEEAAQASLQRDMEAHSSSLTDEMMQEIAQSLENGERVGASRLVAQERTARDFVRIGASPTEIKKAIWQENPDASADERRAIYDSLKQDRATTRTSELHKRVEAETSTVPKLGKLWKNRILYVDKEEVGKAAGLTFHRDGNNKIVGATLVAQRLNRDEAFDLYKSLPTVSISMATGEVKLKKAEEVRISPERSEKLNGFIKWRVEQQINYAKQEGGLDLLVKETK